MKQQKQAESLYELVHGDNSIEKLKEAFVNVCPELADYCVDFIFGNIYANDVLSLRDRELLNIAALVVDGSKMQLRNHILAAFNVGCSSKEIIYTILQMLIITGFPRVVNAMLLAKEVFEENTIEAF